MNDDVKPRENTAEDAALVEMLWQRREEGLRGVSEKYGRLAHTLSRHIVQNPSDAEECVNDALMALWQAVPPARPVSLCAFFCSLVRHLSYNRYDYQHADKRHGDMPLILEELADVLPSPDREETAFESQQITEVINAFLREEAQADRILFVRRYYFSDPLTDLADRYGKSEGALAMRLLRMRNRLRKRLEEEGISL